MPQFIYHYEEVPFDGHDETVDEPFLQPDIARRDPRTDTWHHYALVTPLPDFSASEPYDLYYKHLSQFDQTGDYMDRVAKRRADEMR
jgi:hypothetical protein